jgi:uncharacterized delta-60 repeat protein
MKYFRRKTQHLRQNFLFGFLAIGLFLALPALTLAAPGDLDPTFGNGGIVITGQGNTLDAARAMAIQSDGKIVVVGDGNVTQNNNSEFAVARYNTDGSLDTSFGGTGIVIISAYHYDRAYAVAIQSDGKIVVAGGMFGSFAIVRYNPNGSLDTSFGGTGIVFPPLSAFESYAYAVAIQADGKIVAAGTSDNPASFDFAVVRYNPNGSLDTTFNGTGIVTTQIGNISVAFSIAIQADGKIIAAGYTGYPNSNFALVRYNSNGSLDTSFNGTGIVTTPVGGANSVAIQADGKIVAAGGNTLVRYNTDGTLDTSFNGTGKVIIPVGSNSVAIQADGKIVAAGNSGNNTGSDFAVVRLNPNGSLDTTFNGTGKVTTPVTDGNDFASAVAIQADGKIVAAGGSSDGSNRFNFTLVRYQGNSNSNIRTRFDFDGDGRADISVFRPSDGVWYLNQSTNGLSATQFGLSTDKITPADFDGDGKTDVAVFREGVWYLQRSSLGFTAVAFGAATDIPVPADFDADGRAEIAVYRPSNGSWYIYNLANNQTTGVLFGASEDKPVPADYDGDGKADVAVFRPSNGVWYLQRSQAGFAGIAFGTSEDKPVPADYDGDGKTDIAVFRPSNGTWYLQRSQLDFTGMAFGFSTDIPTPADYDGDGKADVAVYRPSNGTWYIQRSGSGLTSVAFGEATDRPAPNAFIP